MNKKINISILIISSFVFVLFFLTSCGEKTIDDCETMECIDLFKAKDEVKKELENAKNDAKKEIWNISDNKKEEMEYEIQSFICDDDWLESNCIENKKWINNIWNILQMNETVCDLWNNFSENNYNNIFYSYTKWIDTISDINLLENDKLIKTLTFKFSKWEVNHNDKEWKEINIMYDLTYFWKEWSKVEEDILNNRKNLLNKIISEWIWKFKIEYWDKVNLSYVWTNDYWILAEWHSNTAITENNTFILKDNIDNLSWEYEIKYICEKNKRKKTLKVYYKFQKEKNSNIEEKFNKKYLPSFEKLNEEILNSINNKYESWKYNRWSYLIESLEKNKLFINWTWSINILISDMFFQIHPEMKKNKDIVWPEFDFDTNNILKLWKYIEYTSFYNDILPKYLENKCTNNEDLYIIWIELWDNLDVKKKMKDYYKNILFKWCNVYFN